jgi:hypothetical protein
MSCNPAQRKIDEAQSEAWSRALYTFLGMSADTIDRAIKMSKMMPPPDPEAEPLPKRQAKRQHAAR